MATLARIAAPVLARVLSRPARTGALGAVLVVAFGLRLIPVLVVPSLNWADEVFQTTEQAHRLVYGTGLVPWEFQLGMRSWLLPGAIAGLMEVARIFGDGPAVYLPAIAGALGLLALIPVVCCFLWCERWFGLPGAIVGGLCVAVAPELVYMGDRALTEVVAAHLLVLALYRLDPADRAPSGKRLFWAGAILGLVFVLRIQLAPAILFAALWAGFRAEHRWAALLRLAAGGAGILALACWFDAATLGSPLASIWRYALYNVYYRASSTFGVEPWYYYGFGELAIWGNGFAAVLILAMLGTRQTWLPLLAALVVVAAHSLIAHKEYRFVYPAVVLLAVQAGIGLGGFACSLREWIDEPGRRPRLGRPAVIAIAGLWCVLSLLTWTRPVLAAFRHRAHDYIVAASHVARDPKLCGLGLYGGTAWSWYGGYSYLHRRVPIFWPKDPAELQRLAPAFDVLLYSTGQFAPEPVIPKGFVHESCFGEACVARRAGTCAAAPAMPMPFPAPLARFSARD